ncbi:MAG: gliding motility-associated C-terminal domain-containing protein [Bacteroidota bacterium]|jgi:gliding motility-associated-like protein
MRYESIRNLFFSLTFLFSILFVKSQSWDWAISAGGIKSDKGIDMDTDNNGDLYVCGYYNTTSVGGANFGSLPTSATGFGKEGFLAKASKNGTWQWVKIAQGGWDERVLGMCVDKVNDFVIVTGTCWNQTDFGSCINVNYPGSSDEIFIGKFDLNGNCQWLIGAGGSSDDHGFDVVTDKLGNIYLTGLMSNEYNVGQPASCTFGSLSIPVPIGEDSLGFVAKLTPNGTFKWVKTFKATDGERDNRIAIDDSANVYIAGGFWGSAANFGSFTGVSAGGIDIFVTKFDSAGNQKWLKTAGGLSDDRANAITVDKYGDIYITGEFRDRISFDGDSLNNNGGPNGRDIFVAKMKRNGSWVWEKKAGSNSGSERGNRIVSNSSGNIFVTGQFQDTAKFGANLPIISTNGIQVFTSSIDTAGVWKWVLQAGGTSDEDRGNALAVDENCNLYSCGYYENTGAFDQNSVTASGSKDIFLAKVSQACPLAPFEIEGEIALPTAFTPNGDGLNDLFYTYGTSEVSQFEFEIFNRWGQKIFSTNDKTKGWDGRFNGSDAPVGVYAYHVKAIIGNKTKALSGNVTLIR